MQLERLLESLEQQPLLLHPEEFPKRMEALDQLEILLAETLPGPQDSTPSTPASRALHLRAEAIVARLHAANLDLYRSIRHEIQTGKPHTRFPWRNPQQPAPASAPSGFTFDLWDDLAAGILQLEEPDAGHCHPGGEMVFYQPTPARHIFYLLTALSADAALSTNDVLIDLGSGLGHVPLLTAICTPARSIGIEREPAYVQSARQCAEALNLSNVTFLTQDAREADLSTGTVFYLYTPFTGTILASVLRSLQQEARHRPIRIATFGPCTSAIAEENWLTTTESLRADRIVVFHSH